MTLFPELLHEIRDHARTSYPEECCGIVLALPEGRQRVVRLRNVQNEMHARDPERYPRTARNAYVGDPGQLQAALKLADCPGHGLLAFYHSHPDHKAYFSEEDIAQATAFGEPSYPEALQIVVSVVQGRVGEIKAFRWSAKRASYVGVPFARE